MIGVRDSQDEGSTLFETDLIDLVCFVSMLLLLFLLLALRLFSLPCSVSGCSRSYSVSRCYCFALACCCYCFALACSLSCSSSCSFVLSCSCSVSCCFCCWSVSCCYCSCLACPLLLLFVLLCVMLLLSLCYAALALSCPQLYVLSVAVLAEEQNSGGDAFPSKGPSAQVFSHIPSANMAESRLAFIQSIVSLEETC